MGKVMKGELLQAANTGVYMQDKDRINALAAGRVSVWSSS